MKVYLLITIDTECDKGIGWKIQRPMRFESVLYGIPELLTPLFDKFKLKPTYLLSPEVIYNYDCVKIFRSLECAEVGTHLHGEFIPPMENLMANRTKTPQLHYSYNIEKEKLTNLTRLFANQFGYQPKSFRAGRWGISNRTLTILEDLGYWVDSSVCPFRTHTFSDEGVVNFWGSPLQPYHPSKIDFRKKGKMNIVEMPATLWNKHLARLPNLLTRQFSDKSHFYKRVFTKLGISSKINWLRPLKSTAEEMIDLSDEMVKFYINKKDSIFLNMMFHSNEIICGASPYVTSAEDQKRFINSMYRLFEHLTSKYEMVGIGLSEVKKIYSSDYEN